VIRSSATSATGGGGGRLGLIWALAMPWKTRLQSDTRRTAGSSRNAHSATAALVIGRFLSEDTGAEANDGQLAEGLLGAGLELRRSDRP
jgi:hypothetical protein